MIALKFKLKCLRQYNIWGVAYISTISLKVVLLLVFRIVSVFTYLLWFFGGFFFLLFISIQLGTIELRDRCL